MAPLTPLCYVCFGMEVCCRDANLYSKFLSGQLDNFLALSGQCPDNWKIFGKSFKYKINTINYPTFVDIDNFNQ